MAAYAKQHAEKRHAGQSTHGSSVMLTQAHVSWGRRSSEANSGRGDDCHGLENERA